ncbi:hypothetical protein [Pseudarthrobacter sp. NamE5]|uniref:hypothetical protein n=1 Tax=Pseudarthrobacter sp. NamE5 TaxID=2576839 RepID=UPI00110AAC3E|nr:hypothetical protein [Pseudarthrobacter sp. NamE5]TLM82790.1 hypothetical protein FDW84_15080 [Pseudarthrobacter sp. NamE5]
MTELTEPGNAAAQPSPEWPDTGDVNVSDPVVAQALARLGSLPRVPVAEHESAYNDVHDELLAALNSDPADSHPTDTDAAAGNPANGGA